MKRILNNAISFFVVAIVLLLLIPLPPFALDMMLIFNLSISLVILLITMNIRNPLEFAIFGDHPDSFGFEYFIYKEHPY